jgi:MYXO-CTERM domain-containing protein
VRKSTSLAGLERLVGGRQWLALMVAAGCAPVPEKTVDEIPQPVVNGTEALPCQFPSAVMVAMSGGLCTGTLVHPRLVTFAAHCQLAGTVRSIYFGENATTPARKVGVDSCNFYPDYKPNVNDVAYCVLSEEVKDVPIAPVLMGCETSILQKGLMLDLVGFGITSMKQPRSYGVKRYAQVPLLNTPGPTTNIAQVGTSSSNGCEGDSGGPILAHLDDGTWRTVGVASTTAVDTTAQECISPTNYVLLHRWVSWIETDSGIDITPCHTASGTWSPSADCGHFSTTADMAVGLWDNGCGGPGTVSTGPSMTCGAGTSDGGAATARTDARGDGANAARADGGITAQMMTTPGSSSSPSTPSSASADGGDPSPTLGLPAGHDAGCSCHTGSGGGAVPTVWPLAVVLAVAALRRRRRP